MRGGGGTRMSDLLGDQGGSEWNGAEIPMREPCKWCGFTGAGTVYVRNGQHTVRCNGCGRHVYNAPKEELGLGPITTQSLRDISPSYRVYDLLWAGGQL